MNILIADDDPINQVLLKGILGSLGHPISIAGSGKDAVTQLENKQFDLILCDVQMPGLNGLDVTRHCRRDPKYKDVPILLITALAQKEDLLQGFESGATDYIPKPFYPPELLFRVKAQLQMRNLQVQMESTMNELNLQILQVERQQREMEAKDRSLADANKMLLEMASKDSLTGLFNRRKGWDFMNYEQDKAKRTSKTIGVIMMDLDKFKSINDSLGHDAGDQVLKTASSCLASCMRTTDILIRWGGEEFVAILPETDEPGLSIAAEKIRFAVEAYPWTLADGRKVTVSVGTTLKGPLDTWDPVIEKADRALYEAKTKGRNRVEFQH